MNTIWKENMNLASDPMLHLHFVQRFIRLCTEGAQLRFHERNGGNLSYWLSPEDAAHLPPLNAAGCPIALEAPVPALGGEYFLITASGSYMRNIAYAPDENICLIRLNPEGSGYWVLWGLSQGGRPTSELESHLLNFQAKYQSFGQAYRVMYHAHPEHTIALSHILPPDGEEVTKVLWHSMVECSFIFPNGVGVVPRMIPGGEKIARLTCRLMQKHDAVIWAHHGLFCSGLNFDDAFGLMEAIEKAASIWLLTQAAGTITYPQ